MVLLLLIVQVTCLRVLFLPKSHQDLTTAVVKLKIVITLELLFVLFHSESVGTLIRALAFSCESWYHVHYIVSWSHTPPL